MISRISPRLMERRLRTLALATKSVATSFRVAVKCAVTVWTSFAPPTASSMEAGMSKSPPENLSAEAVRVLEYNDIAVYLAPGEESIRCLFQSDQSFSFALSEIGSVRDDLEEKRDRARQQGGVSESSPLASIEKQQSRIDVFVIIERAVKFIHADAGPERSRHYRRVSALCDDPAAVIENIEGVLESAEAKGRSGGLSTVVWRLLSRASAADRERDDEQ